MAAVGWGYLRPLPVEVLARVEDVDSAKWMEYEQVLVAGEDEVGVASESEGEELVVLGVAAGGDGGYAFDESRCETQAFVESLPLAELNVVVELRAEEYGF